MPLTVIQGLEDILHSCTEDARGPAHERSTAVSQPDPSSVSAPEGRSRPGGRHFGQFSLRHRVLLSQLPLTISAALVAGVVAIFEPAVATGAPHFTVGFGGILLLTVLAGVVPWHRLP